MLTRLEVSGFKNLVGVDVRFGPFTCIAGANGVGKSNLFDAIRFLSALADHPLAEAAQFVRDDEGRGGDVRGLFHCIGDHVAPEMSFVAEMMVPKEGVDDFGQLAKAMGTFLRYKLTLGWSSKQNDMPTLELLEEELQYVTLQPSAKHQNILFPHESDWLESIFQQKKHGRYAPFIATTVENGHRSILQHWEGQPGGRPYRRDASKLPRTVLSLVTAAESPTVVLAKREMQSWRLMQLEPSALRKPDDFSAPARIESDGAHMTATLARLAKGQEENVYQQVTNRLADLLDDVGEVAVDRDEKRELFTLLVRARDHTWHPAKALSDGTLRFLALTVMSLDPEMNGVICLEEPENGIHPERIPAMLELLQGIAVDPQYPVDDPNPLRQVIVNTHSPAVVQEVPADSLLIAEPVEQINADGRRFTGVQFAALPDTWRTRDEMTQSVAKGKLLPYVNPVPLESDAEAERGIWRPRRVIDRDDIRQLALPFEVPDSAG